VTLTSSSGCCQPTIPTRLRVYSLGTQLEDGHRCDVDSDNARMQGGSRARLAGFLGFSVGGSLHRAPDSRIAPDLQPAECQMLERALCDRPHGGSPRLAAKSAQELLGAAISAMARRTAGNPTGRRTNVDTIKMPKSRSTAPSNLRPATASVCSSEEFGPAALGRRGITTLPIRAPGTTRFCD